MENFLTGRATVAKSKPTASRPAGGNDGFSPMFEPRPEPVAATPTLPVAAAPAPMRSSAAAVAPVEEIPPHTHQVSVEVVRVDGAVQGIVVTCKCGERIELDCVY